MWATPSGSATPTVSTHAVSHLSTAQLRRQRTSLAGIKLTLCGEDARSFFKRTLSPLSIITPNIPFTYQPVFLPLLNSRESHFKEQQKDRNTMFSFHVLVLGLAFMGVVVASPIQLLQTAFHPPATQITQLLHGVCPLLLTSTPPSSPGIPISCLGFILIEG